MAGRSWTKMLAVAVLLVSAEMTGLAQSAETGSLSGKLTDLLSKPLNGVTIVLRNQSTGAEARTNTTKNGAYRFSNLEPGEYTLEAESPQLGRGHVDEIQVDAGHEARVQVALEFESLPLSPVLTATHSEERPKVAELPKPAQPKPEQHRVSPPDLQPVTPPLDAVTVAANPMPRLEPAGRSVQQAVTLPAPAGATASQLSETRSDSPQTGPVLRSEKTAVATAPAQTQAQSTQAPSSPVLRVSQESSPAAPAVTTTTSAQELQSLPVSGRRWQDFVLDNTPTSVTPAGGQAQISLRGAGQPAGVAVDGSGRGLAFGSTNGGSASGQDSQGQGVSGRGGADAAGIAQVWAGGHGFAISESSIRAVQTAAGNAGGRAAGGRLNVETQHGTNLLHGQGFLFDRQNTWGARNPFTQWVKETAPATSTTSAVFAPESYTPPDHETTWGIGVGSRIRRDKLFWFAALDSLQRNDPGVAMVKHPDEFFAQPTNDQMQLLSARLGLGSANPEGEGLAAYSKLMETLAGLLGPSPRTATQWTGFGRLDWEATERHRFMLEAIGARWNAPGGGMTRVAETYGSHSFGSTKASEEWLLGHWEAFLTPNLLAVTQVSVGDAIQEARPETPSTFEQSFLHGNAWGQLPQMVVDSRYGFTIGNPSRFGPGSYPDEHLYEGKESVDWALGMLLVKAGFEVRHNADTTGLLRNQTGTYSYSSLENFASDALVFSAYGMSDALDPYNQHNCDETGKVWRDSSGALRGLGSLPCFSYYSQTMGPTGWHLSTNDWAGYATAQWQVGKLAVVSAGLRMELEQRPSPITALKNPELPLTEKLPALGNNWAPRLGLAVGGGESHWPVLRLGYGMYFGRTENATLETALTQTGSLKGDLNLFMRPTDNLPSNGGGAPPFPYVLQGEPGSVVKPGAVEFAGIFRNPEIHQGVVSVEEKLRGHVEVTASAMVSLGRRLPISIDTNFDPAVNPGTITYAVVDSTGKGPIDITKTTQITVPFYASWPTSTGVAGRLNPDYQQITQIISRANSTYEAWVVRVDRARRRGLSLHAHYTYAHAMDWNPNESSQVSGSGMLDPADFSQEYGTSNLDMRHSASAMAIYEAPWKLHGLGGQLGNGWMLSGVGQIRSGLPYTMRTSGSLAKEFIATSGAAIVALGPGMNGSGGDNRVYGVGRNTYRYPGTWKVDLRLARRFDLGSMRQLELLAESFNLLNHQNVTELETTGYSIESGSTSGSLPTLTFLTGLKANTTAFGQPLNVNATNFYRERQIQFGLRMRF
jgi:hypothetical protein